MTLMLAQLLPFLGTVARRHHVGGKRGFLRLLGGVSLSYMLHAGSSAEQLPRPRKPCFEERLSACVRQARDSVTEPERPVGCAQHIKGHRNDTGLAIIVIGHAALILRGRPPFRPFFCAARCFALLLTAPPRFPISLIQRLVPRTPSTRPGT